MVKRGSFAALLGTLLVVVIISGGFCSAEERSLSADWEDFLHYSLIGRLDLAKAYAQAIIQRNPDPVELLELSRRSRQAEMLLARAKENKHDPELAELAQQLWGIVEKGRLLKRSDAHLIYEQVKKLSTTDRGYLLAVKRLKQSGEYAVPFMLDALGDPQRKDEWPNIIKALPELSRPAIRPLVSALQTTNTHVKAEVIRALGRIQYPQGLPYLKYVVEKEESPQLRRLAADSIRQINPAGLSRTAAELFYQLGQDYYYHSESLAPAADADFANIWFWDAEKQKLTREQVDKAYFHELMAMRCCEWALKADEAFGRAIGLWIAAFFKAESTNVAMPRYFGPGHADAITYATTAGPQYLHQALARALKDKNAYVALGAVEALAVTAGEKSLFYQLGGRQPLVEALRFEDRAVRYSAAIAIAAAGPREMFLQRGLVTETLSEALGELFGRGGEEQGGWNRQLAEQYAVRSLNVMRQLAVSRNTVIDLMPALDTLVKATEIRRPDVQDVACEVLAYLESPDAQRAIAAVALEGDNPVELRIAAFESLGRSAKMHGSLLDEASIDGIYSLVGSKEADPSLRSAAAAAYGALNLPSERVKDLILDQSRS